MYPFISNHIAEKECSEVYTEHYKAVEKVNDEIIEELLAAAQQYNDALNPVCLQSDSENESQTDYNELLNINGDGIMGYIEIPKIDVLLPIYHGTGANALNNGVGHLVESSLPVGGAGTHTILTGHSGLAGKRLFSDLDRLKVGDLFYLHILNDELVYRVTELHTVEPNDISLLVIKQGKDRCTLITCTPIGVNTHRLLVQADRVTSTNITPASNSDNQDSPSVSTWEKEYCTGLLFGGIISISLMLVLVILCLLKNRRKNENKRKKI